MHAEGGTEVALVNEMAIVDTFTKLIFGEEGYSARELSIIRAFRAVDTNVLCDSHGEMGEYLRNLGVSEMIHLVARLREYMCEELRTLTARGGCSEHQLSSRQNPRSRRPH